MQQTHPLGLLREARDPYTQVEIAKILNVDVRTVRHWEAKENDPPDYLSDAIRQRILPLIDTRPRSLSENSQPTAEKHKSAIFHPRLR